MCGIVGVFAQRKIEEGLVLKLKDATAKLAKRGPDANGIWHDEHVGLGHRRLSILDTSDAANQPMHTPDQRYHLVYNGEIFNFRQLRDELKAKGRAFQTGSDTEVLLHGWAEWGVEVINRLNGFFAFAIYDQLSGDIYLVRDRYGIKPLVYSLVENQLYFASELKAILAFGIEKEINVEALNLYFQFTYIPPPHTIFSGVQKLKPGHYLKFSKAGEVWCEPYYEVPYHEHPVIDDFEMAVQQLRHLMTSAVRDRLVSDVPLGTFLSGGIDSSVVSLLASKEVTRLSTFSIGYQDHPFFDETRFAELVAKRYQTDHHTFSLTNHDLLNHVDEVVDYLDEPFADSSALPVYILSKLTRQHVTVALSGDGADEIFSGYNKHLAWQLSSAKNLSNAVIATLAPLLQKLPQSRNNRWGNIMRQLSRYAEMAGLSDQERYWFLASFQSGQLRQRLLKTNYWDSLMGIKEQMKFPDSDLNRMLWNDVKWVLSGDMLPKVDLMSMANGLEVRVPFLDYRLVSFAFQLPAKFKINGMVRKHLLKEAFRNDLPPELYDRGKHGFEVPLLDWFRKELAAELDRVVFNKEMVQQQDVFQWDEIQKIKHRLFSNNPGDVHILVWQLYVFQRWWKNYF